MPTVLVSYNWPLGSNRYQRVARFTDYLFSRIDKLQVAGFDPKWKTINLRATVPGLTRFPAAQEWLDRQARKPQTNSEDRHDLRGFDVRAGRARARWRKAPAMRWRSSAPARSLRKPNGSTAWRSFPATSHLRHRRARRRHPRPRWCRRPTTGSSARRPHPSTTRPSPSPPRVRRRAGRRHLQLSIQCRGGRTDLLIAGPALTRRGEDYVLSYSVNDGQPVVVAAGTPASGAGIAVRGDVVRLLASLPDRGDIAFRVTARQGGATLEGRYALAGLKAVLDRLAAPCKWPAASRNR